MSLPREVDDFKHIPIPLRTIRLIQIQMRGLGGIGCQLINVPLVSKPEGIFEYKAISYTWGSNQKTHAIEMDGKRFCVTSNLYALLNDLCRVERELEYFWIDAICINQEDDDEKKSQQVQMMGEIYSTAREVIIFLGRSVDPDNVLMLSLLRMESETRGKYWPPTDKQWDTAWKSVQTSLGEWNQNLPKRQLLELKLIIRNPWIRRVWILQEVANARSATVLYGCQRISTRIFALAPRLIGVELDKHQQAVFDLMPGPSKRYSWWNSGRDLCTLLRKFSAAKATEERDKIYALLGMCKDGSSNSFLVPSYKQPISEVILRTASYIYSLPLETLPKIPATSVATFLSALPYLDIAIPVKLVESCSVGFLGGFLENNRDVPVSEGLLIGIARRGIDALGMMNPVFQRREQEIQITKPVVATAARNRKCGKAMIELLLHKRPKQVVLCQSLIEAAVGNEGNGQEIIQVLLDEKVGKGARIPNVLVLAINRLRLFPQPEKMVVLTGQLAKILANSGEAGNKAIESYLRNPSCQVTEAAIQEFINTANSSVISLLFQPGMRTYQLAIMIV